VQVIAALVADGFQRSSTRVQRRIVDQIFVERICSISSTGGDTFNI